MYCLKPCVGSSSGAGNLCRRHRLPYADAWCVAGRSGVLAKVIDEYKFRRVRAADVVLAALLAAVLPDELAITGGSESARVIIVPVPTTPQNERIRGYDHMKRIARRLGAQKKWRVSPLLRRQNNITQHFAKTAEARRAQAKTFFGVRGEIDSEATYLVIDDIYTTGSTLEAAAKCLRDASAARVVVAILARQGEN